MKSLSFWRSVSATLAVALIFNAGSLLATTVALVGGQYAGFNTGYSGYNTYTTALFNTPCGLAMDSSGNLWVADENNNAIREITNPEQSQGGGSTTTTFAALPANLIVKPLAVAFDSNGNLYVLDFGNGKNGNVLEYNPLTYDIIATNAINLTNAAGMTMDVNNNIYVTINTNQILEITAPGVSNLVTTITNAGTNLRGLVVKRSGTTAGQIAVCDSGRNGIYLVNLTTGAWTTNAGFHGAGDFPLGTDISSAQDAKFSQPMGLAETGDGSLVVSDYGNERVKVVVASSGNVTNLYGVTSNDWVTPYPGFSSSTDQRYGTPQVVVTPDTSGGVSSRLPNGLVIAADGTIFVSEDYYHMIREVTSTGLPLPAPGAPETPTGLTAVTNSSGGVVLTWGEASSDATNYNIERATSSNGTYETIGNTAATSFTDTSPLIGDTNFYEVNALNTGGASAYSTPASIFLPPPAPPTPEIGWYDFEGDTLTGFFSVLHPVSGAVPYSANNPLNIAILPTNGVQTHYITIPPSPTGSAPSQYIGASPPLYVNNQAYPGTGYVSPLTGLSLSNGLVIVEAMSYVQLNDGSYVTSVVDTAEFLFQAGTPQVIGNNAANFTLTDITTNVTFFYTLDGSDPTNAPPSQQISTTNGMVTLSLNGSTNINFEARAYGYGPDAGYEVSGIEPFQFSPANFVPNTLSWGFTSGECSSEFVGAAGQTFYVPVTLTMLPGVTLYSLQFNMTVLNTGPGVTNPAPAPGPFAFQSMMLEPGVDTNAAVPVYQPIPPLMDAAVETSQLPPQDYVTNGSGQIFVNDLISNGNELAVGWVERYGFTNLYNTKAQTLISYSQAHDDLFPNGAQPNGVIVGGYSFQISPGATNGQQYQIELNGASGTSDGIGASDVTNASVNIFTEDATNSVSLGAGSLNGIKNITVGSVPYLVGDVFPFRWFNAGDFGSDNLIANGSADIEQVFEAAVYGINAPPPGSDMLDAMDSSGGLGVVDNDPTSEFYGYWTNAGPANEQTLLGGNITNINMMAFGDGNLDVADVFVTFLRSQFTNQLVWFQRVWTNGVLVATATNAPDVISQAVQQPSGGKIVDAVSNSTPAISITNTATVNFAATDFLASAGQTLTIPVNATIFGQFPLRMLMLNLSVIPLDGSPALTSQIQFTPSAALNALAANPTEEGSSGEGNISGAWLPKITIVNGSINYSAIAGMMGLANLGTLTVTLPTNATSMSSYAIHFDHASASPNGIVSFPKQTLTGLITLSDRSSSSYNDGIPDSWRLRYFGTIDNLLSVSNADADGTGMENWQKYQAGLDPMNPASKLAVGTDQPMAQGTQDSVVDWPTVNGKTYVIERSATLFPPAWTPVSTNMGDGTYMEIHDSPTNSYKFYRVEVP